MEAASVTEDASAGIRLVNGRTPINGSRYAGGAHPSGVAYTPEGFPDFTPYARSTVRVEGLTGTNYAADEAAANRAAGLSQTPKNYTWHHVEDCITMQLVPTAIHAATRHTGGAAIIRAGEC